MQKGKYTNLFLGILLAFLGLTGFLFGAAENIPEHLPFAQVPVAQATETFDQKFMREHNLTKEEYEQCVAGTKKKLEQEFAATCKKKDGLSVDNEFATPHLMLKAVLKDREILQEQVGETPENHQKKLAFIQFCKSRADAFQQKEFSEAAYEEACEKKDRYTKYADDKFADSRLTLKSALKNSGMLQEQVGETPENHQKKLKFIQFCKDKANELEQKELLQQEEAAREALLEKEEMYRDAIQEVRDIPKDRAHEREFVDFEEQAERFNLEATRDEALETFKTEKARITRLERIKEQNTIQFGLPSENPKIAWYKGDTAGAFCEIAEIGSFLWLGNSIAENRKSTVLDHILEDPKKYLDECKKYLGEEAVDSIHSTQEISVPSPAPTTVQSLGWFEKYFGKEQKRVLKLKDANAAPEKQPETPMPAPMAPVTDKPVVPVLDPLIVSTSRPNQSLDKPVTSPQEAKDQKLKTTFLKKCKTFAGRFNLIRRYKESAGYKRKLERAAKVKKEKDFYDFLKKESFCFPLNPTKNKLIKPIIVSYLLQQLVQLIRARFIEDPHYKWEDYPKAQFVLYELEKFDPVLAQTVREGLSRTVSAYQKIEQFGSQKCPSLDTVLDTVLDIGMPVMDIWNAAQNGDVWTFIKKTGIFLTPYIWSGLCFSFTPWTVSGIPLLQGEPLLQEMTLARMGHNLKINNAMRTEAGINLGVRGTAAIGSTIATGLDITQFTQNAAPVVEKSAERAQVYAEYAEKFVENDPIQALKKITAEYAKRYPRFFAFEKDAQNSYKIAGWGTSEFNDTEKTEFAPIVAQLTEAPNWKDWFIDNKNTVSKCLPCKMPPLSALTIVQQIKYLMWRKTFGISGVFRILFPKLIFSPITQSFLPSPITCALIGINPSVSKIITSEYTKKAALALQLWFEAKTIDTLYQNKWLGFVRTHKAVFVRLLKALVVAEESTELDSVKREESLRIAKHELELFVERGHKNMFSAMTNDIEEACVADYSKARVAQKFAGWTSCFILAIALWNWRQLINYRVVNPCVTQPLKRALSPLGGLFSR